MFIASETSSTGPMAALPHGNPRRLVRPGAPDATIINPPGFAFEHYDALGQFRDTDHGMPVDASGTFGTGETFTDAVDFAALLADSPTAHACYIQNWLEFMYGRVATPQDADSLQDLSNRSRLEDRAILDLLVDLTVSESFRVRASEVP